MEIYWNKGKRLLKKKFNSHRIGMDTTMAAVSLFWNINMAPVTSCERFTYTFFTQAHLCC